MTFGEILKSENFAGYARLVAVVFAVGGSVIGYFATGMIHDFKTAQGEQGKELAAISKSFGELATSLAVDKEHARNQDARLDGLAAEGQRHDNALLDHERRITRMEGRQP